MPAVIHVLLHENTNASQSGALSIFRLQAWSRGHIGGVGYHRIFLPDQFSARVAIAWASRRRERRIAPRTVIIMCSNERNLEKPLDWGPRDSSYGFSVI
jgi:hypothetical protein